MTMHSLNQCASQLYDIGSKYRCSYRSISFEKFTKYNYVYFIFMANFITFSCIFRLVLPVFQLFELEEEIGISRQIMNSVWQFLEEWMAAYILPSEDFTEVCF